MRTAAAQARIASRLRAELQSPVQPEVYALAHHLAKQYGPAVAAILFYGSCLRGKSSAGLLDLYVLVDGYSAAGLSVLGAAASRLLPPTVYHHTQVVDSHRLQAKVTVIALDQVASRVKPGSLDTTVWARFCQPLALVYARSPGTIDELVAILSDAVITSGLWAARLGPSAGSPQDYWQALFRATYAAELRVERAERSAQLWDAAPGRYALLLADAWDALGLSADALANPLTETLRRRYRAAWALRRWTGKLLNVARLIKAAFTFDGGAGYLVWKIERHSGYRVALTPFQRDHPVLAAPSLLWRLVRRRIVR